jgi:LPXTG-motif cell wall-anchored protein
VAAGKLPDTGSSPLVPIVVVIAVVLAAAGAYGGWRYRRPG